MGVGLVMPHDLAVGDPKRDGRVGIEVGSWTAAPVGVLRRSDEGRRVRDADVEEPRSRRERRRIPRTPTGVDRRISPQTRRGHSVETPQQLARALSHRIDEAPVTADIDPPDTHGHGRGDHVSPDHLRLNVDPVGHSAGQPRRPQLPARGLVQCEERRRCDPEYLPPPDGDALRADRVPVRRRFPDDPPAREVDVEDLTDLILDEDVVTDNDRGRREATRGGDLPGRGQTAQVLRRDGRACSQSRIGGIMVRVWP